MKVTIYDKDEPTLIAGSLEIPDDVIDAAKKVSEWMEKQDTSIEIYGLKLAD